MLSAAAAQQGLAQDKYPSRPKEVATILRMPEVKERLAADGSEVVAGTPEEFAALIKAEIAKWAKVVKAAGIQPE